MLLAGNGLGREPFNSTIIPTSHPIAACLQSVYITLHYIINNNILR